MIFIKNEAMDNLIGVVSFNRKWSLIFINTGEYSWSPSKFVTKLDQKVNEDNIISIDQVPKQVLINLIKYSFNMDKIEGFKKILE